MVLPLIPMHLDKKNHKEVHMDHPIKVTLGWEDKPEMGVV
jgi:hypothetical protein